MKISSQVAAGLLIVGMAASGAAVGGSPTPAPAAAPAASAPRADAVRCAASAPPPRRTSKTRHVPTEGDPCAGTTGIGATGRDMPESLRAARRAAAASGARR